MFHSGGCCEIHHCQYSPAEPRVILQTELLLASILLNLEYLCANMGPSRKKGHFFTQIPFWQLVVAMVTLITILVIAALIAVFLLR